MEQDHQPSGQSQDTSGAEVENQEHSQETQEQQGSEQVRDPAAVAKKNRELMAEKKRLKEEAEQYKREKARLEQEELERQGKYEEALKREREERERIEKEKQESDQRYAYSTVSSQIKQRAAQEGCLDPEKLIRLASQEDVDLIEYDEDYQVDSHTLEAFMDKMKKENDFMFKKAPSAPRDRHPGSSPQDFQPKKVDIYQADKKTQSELYRKMRERELGKR